MTDSDSDDRRARFAALCYLTFVLVGSINGALRSSDHGSSGPIGYLTYLVGSLVFHSVTGYLIYRMPRHGVTRVLTVMGLLQSVGAYGSALSAADGTWPSRVEAALSNVAWVAFLPMLALLILVVPTGQPPSPRWRPVLVLQVVCLAALAGGGVWFGLWPREGIGPLNFVMGGFGAVLLITAVAAIASQVIRWRRADGEERAQLRVVALGSALVVTVYLTPILGTSLGLVAALAGLPVALGYAMLRHRLYDLDPIVNRVLVWAVLTSALLAVYLGVALLVADLLPDIPGLRAGLLPAAVVAVVFAALRQYAQRLVDWTLYGARGDPGRAVRTLARRLMDCASPEEVPMAVADAVAASLRLPWAAVILDRDGQQATVAEVGTPVTGHQTIALRHAGETVGWLTVGHRRGESTLPTPDQRLLTDLAAQASPALATARLVDQLGESRDRLARQRQEDRQRLRAELHEHLSPTLTGFTLGAHAARKLLVTDPKAADALLGRMADDASQSADEVRRLLADLRPAPPPGPDLVAALTDRCDELGRSAGLDVTLRAAQLPVLPAATEVAAYRIVVEALTNVVRHARARTCKVELSAGTSLVVTINDDGVGIDGHADGIGLASMRERARDAGGSLRVESSTPHGTQVQALLPLAGRP